MKKFLVLLLIALVFSPMSYAQLVSGQTASDAVSEAAAPAKKYFCPMDGFESDQPGKCEKCGMDLVEKPEVPADAVTTEALPTA